VQEMAEVVARLAEALGERVESAAQP